MPLVITTHSLEPLRPWKVEQLGNAYGLSAWIERTAIESADAVIAVSQETRADVLRHFAVPAERVHVIHNGIDLDEYRPDPGVDALVRYGIDPDRPYVLFVGRITRQKGIIHLVNAIPAIDPSLQVVLCAGAPDTPEIGEEMADRVAEVERRPCGRDLGPGDGPPGGCRSSSTPTPRSSAARRSTSRSASSTSRRWPARRPSSRPRSAASPRSSSRRRPGCSSISRSAPGTFDPVDPARFSADLAAAVNRVGLDPALRERFGRAGRRRVEEHFSWAAIARETMDLYRSVAGG